MKFECIFTGKDGLKQDNGECYYKNTNSKCKNVCAGVEAGKLRKSIYGIMDILNKRN
tara:strand:- start:1572 stop:1742 length:171 start_codon:yes stop_codon:yes gene_type:complete